MIQKIRDLMKIKEEIDNIKNSVDGNKKSFDSFREKFLGFESELIKTKEIQKEFLNNLKENLNVIKDVKEELRNEVYQFKLLKSQLQNKLIEKFEGELRNELKVNLDNLKNDLNSYNDTKKSISTILDKTENLSGEIGKFIEISRNIKKEDFELKKFADELKKADKEKLDLMRRIDTLERLISKMRRRNV